MHFFLLIVVNSEAIFYVHFKSQCGSVRQSVSNKTRIAGVLIDVMKVLHNSSCLMEKNLGYSGVKWQRNGALTLSSAIENIRRATAVAVTK